MAFTSIRGTGSVPKAQHESRPIPSQQELKAFAAAKRYNGLASVKDSEPFARLVDALKAEQIPPNFQKISLQGPGPASSIRAFAYVDTRPGSELVFFVDETDAMHKPFEVKGYSDRATISASRPAPTDVTDAQLISFFAASKFDPTLKGVRDSEPFARLTEALAAGEEPPGFRAVQLALRSSATPFAYVDTTGHSKLAFFVERSDSRQQPFTVLGHGHLQTIAAE
jgi:hypothetical protein